MNDLLELTIVRHKLVIKMQRELTHDDLVPVREEGELNSISFILGDSEKWDYKQGSKEYIATTKLRLYNSETILEFIKANKGILKLDSIDQTYLSDLTKVFKVKRTGKSKIDIQENCDLDKAIEGNKNRIIRELLETIEDINQLAETMGGIL